MAKAKKGILPKDFESLLETSSVDELKVLFDSYDLDARDRGRKQTALAFPKCPDELARWLVGCGADLEAEDQYGDTPLQSRASHWSEHIEILLELGADANRENMGGTPLHAAARSYRVANAGTLLRRGARVDALNRQGYTPLVCALLGCSNASIRDMAALAELLLQAGAQQTPQMKEIVARIGANFEFHRGNFNPDYLEATDAALGKLYFLFGVPPTPRRVQHDGKTPIVTRSVRWQDQFQELWELLIPSSGPAATVQGEVIRIAGRIDDEMQRNGGTNWDREYKKLADAFLIHIASGVPLTAPLLTEARQLVGEIKRSNPDTERLCEIAVGWVALNPVPINLQPPNYRR